MFYRAKVWPTYTVTFHAEIAEQIDFQISWKKAKSYRLNKLFAED